MRGVKIYGILIAVVILIYLLIENLLPRSVSWAPSYDPADKDPYGTYVFFHSLSNLFPNNSIKTNGKNFYLLWEDYEKELREGTAKKQNLIFIDQGFYYDKVSIDALMKYVAAGNNVFISVENFSRNFSDTLGFSTNYYWNSDDVSIADLQEYPNDSAFAAEYVYHTFGDFDKMKFPYTILGYTKLYSKKPSFIKVDVGEGSFYLNLFPIAFTNYHILNGQSVSYAERVMGYLPDAEIVWDNSTRTFEDANEQEEISLLLKNPRMKWVYYISIWLLILFIIFRVKREQRAIPVVEPPRNDSLALVGSIAQLYLGNPNHIAIAQKMIRHFLAYVQNRYYLRTHRLDDDFVERLSKKSAYDKQELQELINIIRQIINSKYLDDNNLILLNHKIEKFKEKAK